MQKKKNQAQRNQDATVLQYPVVLVNVFLFPQAQAGLFSRPSSGSAGTAASTELPASALCLSQVAKLVLVPVGSSGQM